MGGGAYDADALVAAERNNRQIRALHAGYIAEAVIPPSLLRFWQQRGEEIPARPA